MRVIEGENELRLTCSRSASGGIALLRCETQDDIVRLPDEIDGVPVTEVGAYVLSERAPDLTGKDTFAVRITCGGTEPKHNAAAIRTVTLPKDAKSVGSYAFYNCRNLERIELTDSVSEFGGGALMNCMSLREVILHAAPSAPTCLPSCSASTPENSMCGLMSTRGCCSPSTSRSWRISVPRISFSGASTARVTATANALTAAC